MRGREPVAITKCFASMVSTTPSWRFTSTALGDVKRALPRTSATMPPFALGTARCASWRPSSERRSLTAVRTDSITLGYETSRPPTAW